MIDPELAFVLGKLGAFKTSYITKEEIAKGSRRDAIWNLTHDLVRADLSNHEVLLVTSYLAERLGVYDDSNLFKKWHNLLEMLYKAKQAASKDD